MKTKLSEQYRQICDEYVRKFCQLYNLIPFDDDVWVANEAGTIACIGDLFLDFHDVIKYSVDNSLTDYDELLKWYDYNLFAAEYNQTTPNFSSWVRGCPRMSPEEQERLKSLKSDFEDAVKEYNDKYQQRNDKETRTR